MNAPACQACGLPVAYGSDCIRVSYGILGVTAHPHLRLERRSETDDYFHRACAGNVAIRAGSAQPEVQG
jgi:hypothetical protein